MGVLFLVVINSGITESKEEDEAIFTPEMHE